MKCSEPNYYSLDDILATQEQITCKFKVPVYRLGFLNPSVESNNLETGTELELPCWMVEDLSTARTNIVHPGLPKSFKPIFRDILNADACVVNLREMYPYFYEMGIHALQMTDSNPVFWQISRTLMKTLRERLPNVMNAAQNGRPDEAAELSYKFSVLEKNLFNIGQASLRDKELWIRRKNNVIRSSPLLGRYGRKRKFYEITK